MKKRMISEYRGNILVSGMAVEKKYEYHTDGGRRVTKKLDYIRNFPINKDEALVEPWLDELQYVREDLFSRSRQWAWEKIVEVDPNWWPHRFRSERASQLVKDYKWNVPQLLQWFGWSSVKEASSYVRLNIDDLMESFTK